MHMPPFIHESSSQSLILTPQSYPVKPDLHSHENNTGVLRQVPLFLHQLVQSHSPGTPSQVKMISNLSPMETNKKHFHRCYFWGNGFFLGKMNWTIHTKRIQKIHLILPFRYTWNPIPIKISMNYLTIYMIAEVKYSYQLKTQFNVQHFLLAFYFYKPIKWTWCQTKNFSPAHAQKKINKRLKNVTLPMFTVRNVLNDRSS